ncbi:MAG: M20/M25/M40 family metallo-hydrolase, partial [candidate division KSB1 bacterium]|nr:M20/M25/M40 family metallo-hydrolase [candidate division KSB1 bacterium]
GGVLGSNDREITVRELMEHLFCPASDALAGRAPGTAGDDSAAAYILRQISLPNVRLLGDQGFQPFEITTSIRLGTKNTLFDGDSLLTAERDFMPLSFSASGSLDAAVVFAGYGFDLQTDSLSWNDYDSLDVAGKWVLLLRGDPELDRVDSPFASIASLRSKVITAKDHGAAGVLFVAGKAFDAKDDLPSLNLQEGSSPVDLPILQVKKRIVDQWLADTGFTVDSLESRLNSTRKPVRIVFDRRVAAEVEVERVTGFTRNVAALLPGSDPLFKDEIILIGAHYDHLGMGGPGSGSRTPDTLAVHNGADDNASGVALAVELFEKLALDRRPPKRSVLFIAFGAEERGSLGAKFFIQNPLVDLKKIVFMLNLDMVGRLDSTLTLLGSGTAIGVDSTARNYAEKHKLALTFSPEGLGPSDHAAFYAENIPVLMAFTGLHQDYHTPEDDVEKINLEGMKRIGCFLYDFVNDIADRPTAPAFQLAGPQRSTVSRRQLKVTLGIMPDMTGQEKRGLRVDGVSPDRPAFRAGIQKGDIIIAIDGKPVHDIYEYMHRMGQVQPGSRIHVEVLRNEEHLILIVDL